MTLYSTSLFFHILGAMGIFTALGLEWISLTNLRRATTVEQAHEWLSIFPWLARIGPISMAFLLLAGIYMTFEAWGWVPWIVISFVAMATLPLLGASNGRRIGGITQEITTQSGKLSLTFRERILSNTLWTSLRTRTAILLGIVFLMTVKPALIGSLTAMGMALLLGIATSLPVWRRNSVASQTRK